MYCPRSYKDLCDWLGRFSEGRQLLQPLQLTVPLQTEKGFLSYQDKEADSLVMFIFSSTAMIRMELSFQDDKRNANYHFYRYSEITTKSLLFSDYQKSHFDGEMSYRTVKVSVSFGDRPFIFTNKEYVQEYSDFMKAISEMLSH